MRWREAFQQAFVSAVSTNTQLSTDFCHMLHIQSLQPAINRLPLHVKIVFTSFHEHVMNGSVCVTIFSPFLTPSAPLNHFALPFTIATLPTLAALAPRNHVQLFAIFLFLIHHRRSLSLIVGALPGDNSITGIMVGIDAYYGKHEFALLYNVDQFALCGINPSTRLTFEELVKQARRVAALLHNDFAKPSGVIPPFTSATANDLKGWLQEHSHSDSEKASAVRAFYANTIGHRGLTWRPFLKDKNGELLPRNHPDIWRISGSTMRTPPSTPPNKRQRSDTYETGDAIPERKRRAYGGVPPSRPSDSWSNTSGGPAPERERRGYGGVPSTPKEDYPFRKDAGAVPERKRTTYSSTPAYREEPMPRNNMKIPSPHTPSSQNNTTSFCANPVLERTRSVYAASPYYREKPVQRTHTTKPSPFGSRSSGATTSKSFARTGHGYYSDSRSSSPSPGSYDPPGTLYSLNDLFKLAYIAGDLSDRRIAIACLPDQQSVIVTMKFIGARLKYRVEETDIVGRKITTTVGKPYTTTFELFTQGNHRFLGRFAGANEEELIQFALVMDKVRHRRQQSVAAGLPPFPLRDRSPSRDFDF